MVESCEIWGSTLGLPVQYLLGFPASLTVPYAFEDIFRDIQSFHFDIIAASQEPVIGTACTAILFNDS